MKINIMTFFVGELLGVDCFYNNDKDKLITLRVDAIEEFSTNLREKIQNGKIVKPFIDDKTLSIINKFNLYK